MQHKDYQTELISRLANTITSNIKCAYLATIHKLTLPTATVQPLAMNGKKKFPMIEQVHFAMMPFVYKDYDYGKPTKRTMPKDYKLKYKKGDNVLVDVLDLDDMFFKNKGKFQIGSKRKHAIDYSIIVGKIADKKDFEA